MLFVGLLLSIVFFVCLLNSNMYFKVTDKVTPAVFYTWLIVNVILVGVGASMLDSYQRASWLIESQEIVKVEDGKIYYIDGDVVKTMSNIKTTFTTSPTNTATVMIDRNNLFKFSNIELVLPFDVEVEDIKVIIDK